LNKLLFLTLLLGLLALWLACKEAFPQDGALNRPEHRHPPQDQSVHERFYSHWHMPDNPSMSCCNDADCYPTDVKYVDGRLYARRREDGKYILVPPQKVERNRDNPDGRNHLCAPPPNPASSSDTVYCFALGGAA
jgi:hypothetical protein